MDNGIHLSAEERALLVELLERERSDLRAEIRHTRTMSYRDQLHDRRERVQALVERLRSMATV